MTYLDTNVFNRLAKTPVTAVSISSIHNRRFTAPVSPTAFHEILATPDKSRRERLFKTALDVCDVSSVLKPVDELINDEIKASLGLGHSNPFQPWDSAQNLIRIYGSRLFDESALGRMRREFQQRNEHWKSGFGSFHDALQVLDPDRTRRRNAIPSFQEQYESLAPIFAEDWARRAAIPTGFDPTLLLNNRAVRAGIGYAVACDWDHKYGSRKCRRTEGNDARDLQHTILAAAACDCLVTGDKIFACRLRRVSLDRFEVLDFDEFVTRVL